MKKHLLLFMGLLGFYSSSFSQSSSANRTADVSNFTIIGTTTYDLQTNGTMPRRLICHQDGTMSAIFAYSQTPSATITNDRGTGYVYFNGTQWDNPPTARLENNGKQPTLSDWKGMFPSICVNAAGKELVVNHHYQLFVPNSYFRTLVSTSSAKGARNWSTVAPIPNNNSPSGLQLLWHKSASTGNNIYVIATSLTKDSVTKIQSGIYLSRSTDGGTIFSNFTLLPEMDTVNYPDGLGASDNYSIDAFDKYVVVTGVGQYTDLAIWKSEDYGQTFTRTVVQKFPIEGWAKKGLPFSDIDMDGQADTLSATDMCPDAIIDKSGKVHLFWGQTRYVQANTDTSVGYPTQVHNNAPNRQIYYWNEINKEIKAIAGAPDLNNNGIVDMPSNPQPFSYGLMGFAGKVTTGIDDQGKLYLVYCAYEEGDTTTIDISDNPGACYYNLFAIRSTDGGLSWTQPVNLTLSKQEDVTEHAFPSMARHVDDNIHIIWQSDNQPGSMIQYQNTPETNSIVYEKWCSSNFQMRGGCQSSVGNKPLSNIEVSIFPNPSSGTARITLSSATITTGTVSIKDLFGRTLSQTTVLVNAGTTTLEQDLSALPNGLYLLNFSTEEGSTQTQRITLAQ